MTILPGKISDGKKKTPSPSSLSPSSPFSRRRWRKRKQKQPRKTSSNIAEQNQKDRNIVCVGSNDDGGAEELAVLTSSSSSVPHLPSSFSWSSTSLMPHLISEHQTQGNCLQTSWKWSKNAASRAVLLDHDQQILFHPRTSSSTEVILADRPLDPTGKHRWEIFLPAVYGTSMMFGIATSKQQRTAAHFTNLIGSDQHGWGLSHQGLLWHNGLSRAYLTRPIEPLKPCLIALEFDADQRTLSYTIDNQPMGVAFRNIPRDVPIYPAVSSTSAQSTMLLKHRCRRCSALKDHCLKRLRSISIPSTISARCLPKHLFDRMNEQ